MLAYVNESDVVPRLVSGAHSASRILSSESLPWQLGTRGATLRHASVDWWFYTRGMVADSLVCRLSVSLLFIHENNQGNDITSGFPVEKLVCKSNTCSQEKLKCMSHGAIGPSLQSWRVHELHFGCIGDAPNSKILGLICKTRV